MALDLLEKLTKSDLILDIAKSDSTLPFKFKNHLSFSFDSTQLYYKESSNTYQFIESSYYWKFKKKYYTKKNYCRNNDLFTIESDFLPHNFVFPRDYISLQCICNIYIGRHSPNLVNFSREQFYADKKYLTLDLPYYVQLPVVEDSRYFKSIKEQNLDTLEYKKSDILKFKFILHKTSLLLEPKFETFDRNIKYLWDLYLLKINYNDLNNTLKINDRKFNTVNYNFIPKIYGPSKINKEIPFENSSIRIQKFLKDDLMGNQEIYKSYYELVLWQMYKCSDFKLRENHTEKASFTFTSQNPEYPGNYEVKFNIYEPYRLRFSNAKHQRIDSPSKLVVSTSLM